MRVSADNDGGNGRSGLIPMVRQKTLKSSINCTGIALHSGAKVSMTLHPASADTGIVFRRVDIAGQGAVIPARWDRVVDARLCTAIGNDAGVRIATIEHLMAAFAGCGVDNAMVEINGPEVPIMDGSAAPFVFLIECAGVVEQSAPRRGIRVLKPITLQEGNWSVSLTPSLGSFLDFEIDFADSAVAQQSLSIAVAEGVFKKELSRARTFGFLHEVEAMRKHGLARGGSLDNAVVISAGRVLNEEGLRYEDEFVRHKLLDALGDLYLAGYPLIGSFQGTRSGHAATNRLLRTLFADRDAWCLEDLDEAASTPIFAGSLSPRRLAAVVNG